MKLLLYLTVFLMSFSASTSSGMELVIYAYDSFMSDGGIGKEIIPLFEKKFACSVRSVTAGNAAQIVTRLEIDAKRGKRAADLVIGLDNNTWERARSFTEPWGGWTPIGYDRIIPEAKMESGFLPYDYGVFSFIADDQAMRKSGIEIPRRLKDLLNPKLKRNLILQDPRTATPGLAFLMYTNAVMGEEAWNFWTSLRSQWLTLAPGWSAGYGLFLKGEAPLVWSYTTSQAYQDEHGGSGRYKALVFEEGQPVQIEGAAFVKGISSNPAVRELARQFMAFLLSQEVQEKIPRGNWMLPVMRGVLVPESFKRLPKPTRIIRANDKHRGLKTDEALKRWETAIKGGVR